MKAMNERLQQLQEEQAQREKDLQRGKIRIEPPTRDPRSTEQNQPTPKARR
jgi:hypothetical protein